MTDSNPEVQKLTEERVREIVREMLQADLELVKSLQIREVRAGSQSHKSSPGTTPEE